MIKKRAFGSTGFEVSEIGFGGAGISGEGGGYGFGDVGEEQAIEIVQYALAKGINLFDTAPVYGMGLSEKRIGLALKDYREDVFIVSKSGVDWHKDGAQKGRINRTNDPVVAQDMLDASLKSLNSDYIDLYMIHWPDENIDIRKPMEVLSKAKQQGKIRHIGLCNTHTEDLQLAMQVDRVDVVQSEFHVLECTHMDALKQYINDHKIGFMSWGTFDRGILTGRVGKDRKYDKSDVRSWAPWWKKPEVKERIEAFELYNKEILQKYSISPQAMALGHNLSYPELSTALVGLKRKDQLDSILEAYEHLPTSEQITEVKNLVTT